MDGNIARATKFACNRRDMKSARRFILQFDVFNLGVVARKNFRHGVCKVGHVAGAEVTFYDRQFAVRFRNHKIARQNGFAILFRGRNINELNRLGDFHALRHKDERAVGKKSLIQRGESIVRRVRVFAEMLFDERGIFRECGREIFNAHTAGNRFDAGKFRAEKSVHEHEPMAGQFGKGRFINQFALRAIHRSFLRQLEI